LSAIRWAAKNLAESPQSTFIRECCNAFRRLVDSHGFAEPEIERIGRETYVRYRKGHHEVSIAYEHGTSPIVELYYPSSETGERPIPWTERNGVERSRRIPRLAVAERVTESDPTSFARYLDASVSALETVESVFLEACPHESSPPNERLKLPSPAEP